MYHTFVSKLDDDAFLNVPEFWHRYLAPRLQTPGGSYFIARNATQSTQTVPYLVPDGGFYTLTWDLVQLLAEEYPRHPRLEDMEPGRHAGFLLSQAGAEFEFVELENEIAFDYDAREINPGAWSHRVTEGAMNPQKMETDVEYLEVASYFDEEGLNMDMIRAVQEEEERRTQAQVVDSGRQDHVESEMVQGLMDPTRTASGGQAQGDTGRVQQLDSGRVHGEVESDRQGQVDYGRTHAQVDSGRAHVDNTGRTQPVQIDSGRTQPQVDSGRNHAQVDSSRPQAQVDNVRAGIV